MTAPGRSATVSEREQQLLRMQLRLARNPREHAREQARRKLHRLASLLGAAAVILALYDLSLLASIRHP